MEGVEELLPPRIPSLFVHTEKLGSCSSFAIVFFIGAGVFNLFMTPKLGRQLERNPFVF